MPKEGVGLGFGAFMLDTVDELELKGFVSSDSIHFFLKAEPQCSFPTG